MDEDYHLEQMQHKDEIINKLKIKNKKLSKLLQKLKICANCNNENNYNDCKYERICVNQSKWEPV